MKKSFTLAALTICLAGLAVFAQSTSQSQNDIARKSMPQPGVELILEQEVGTVVKTVRTDAEGKFVFTDLRPGKYRLKTTPQVASPRDAATGQASGKQAATTSATTEVKSPRDVATGQASGKHTAPTEAGNGEASANTEANRKINTSRSNIKTQRVAAEIILGDDDDPPATKTGVNTSRSNIRNQQRTETPAIQEEVLTVQLFEDEASSTKRAFVLPHVLEKSGLLMQVGANGQLSGRLLKTRHDTAKNAIGNIR